MLTVPPSPRRPFSVCVADKGLTGAGGVCVANAGLKVEHFLKLAEVLLSN